VAVSRGQGDHRALPGPSAGRSANRIPTVDRLACLERRVTVHEPRTELRSLFADIPPSAPCRARRSRRIEHLLAAAARRRISRSSSESPVKKAPAEALPEADRRDQHFAMSANAESISTHSSRFQSPEANAAQASS